MRPLQPLKSVATLLVSNVDKTTVEGEVGVRLCNYVDVYYNDHITNSLPFMEATASAEQVATFGLRQGDVLFTKDSETADDIAVPAYVPADLPGVVCGYHLAIARPRAGAIDGRYLHWALASRFAREQFTVAATGVTRFGLRQDEIRAVKVPVPDLTTQRAIADYLDTETARIDALIAKKQRMIELLVARRLSAMEESLGGGRGAAAYLVGSEATLHRAVPLKRLLSATIAGGTPDSNDSDYWADEQEGVAWVAIGDMADCSTTTGTARRLTPAGLAASRLRVAPAGTLLFAMYASLGKLTVTAMPCVWNQAIIGLVPDQTKADAEYVALWLEALRPHLPLLARSTTQDNLNAEQVRSLPIPLITVEEQRRLVLRLLPVLQQLSTARSVLERQIDLLREHRQALITAAVTGELVIPGVAA